MGRNDMADGGIWGFYVWLLGNERNMGQKRTWIIEGVVVVIGRARGCG